MRKSLATLFLSAVLGSPAAAQTPKPTKTIDIMAAEKIDGTRAVVGDEAIFVRTPALSSSLIRVRRDFLREIVQSAERL